jgi:uncharacterized repeat protein (TIGR03806 family)
MKRLLLLLAGLAGLAIVVTGVVMASTWPRQVVMLPADLDWPPVKVSWQTEIPKTAGRFVPFVAEQAFGDLEFFDPLYVTPLPDASGRLVVVERRGTIQIVEQTDAGYIKKLFLDITPRVIITKDRAEEGLLGLAFHPEFGKKESPHRGEFFAYFVARTPNGPTNRLSRFRTLANHLDEGDPNSELVLIDQPDVRQSHNAGALIFGPDGFLYLGLGDDAYSDPNPHAQTITNDLFSGVLRLDVDCQGGDVSHPPKRQPKTGRTDGYFIPSDNPFVGYPDALEEFYVIGVRNPWRISFDRETGLLYVTDPGDRRREEISVVQAGSNCGWNYVEGTLDRKTYSKEAPSRPEPFLGIETPPLFEYSRDFAHRCVIGGYVYRGTELPELRGQYVYADQSGRIYALELTDGGRKLVRNHLIAVLPEPGIGISSLGEDEKGELYFCTIGQLATETGRVFRLRPTQPNELSKLPETLKETGLFSIAGTQLKESEGVVPFEITLPFWSDGAEKLRWVAVPDGEKISLGAEGNFQFPPGTVFVKHFLLPTDRRDLTKERPLETRILVCDDEGGTYGASYRWSPDGKEARLVTFNETEEIDVTQSDGSKSKQTWFYPGRFECALCHNSGSGQVLGFNLKQLNRKVMLTDRSRRDEIHWLVAKGVLATDVHKVSRNYIPRLVSPDDEMEPLNDRVRSYLDVNCAVCHNPNQRFAAFDARIERPFWEQGLVDGIAYHHSGSGPFVRIVKPRHIEHSVLHLRVAAQDPVLRMPPLASSVVDQKAERLIAEWIDSLPDTPMVAMPIEQSRGQ